MDETIFTFCVLPVALALIVMIIVQGTKHKALQRATGNYKAALKALKAEPSNVDLRQNALAAGRKLVAVARDNKSSVFDEVSLMNDLNAIQTGVNIPQAIATSNTQDITSRLARLEELYNSGTISKEEYQTRRSAILDQI